MFIVLEIGIALAPILDDALASNSYIQYVILSESNNSQIDFWAVLGKGMLQTNVGLLDVDG